MDVVLEVLNVLYVFSKRSNFMGRLSAPRKQEIVIRLLYLAEVSCTADIKVVIKLKIVVLGVKKCHHHCDGI